MAHRVNGQGLLEVQHPETGAWVPAIASLPVQQGSPVFLTPAQASQLQGLAISSAEIRSLVDLLRRSSQDEASNTLLTRLTEVLTVVNQFQQPLEYLDNIDAKVMELQALLDTSNSRLNDLRTLLTNVTGFVDGIEGALAGIIGFVDGVETALAGIDSKIALLNQSVSVKLPVPGLSYRAIATSAGATVKNGTSRLFYCSCTNLNANVRYFQLLDRTGGPNGNPMESYPVYGNNGQLFLDTQAFGADGLAFSVGVTWGFSTTITPYTAAAAADCSVVLRYT